MRSPEQSSKRNIDKVHKKKEGKEASRIELETNHEVGDHTPQQRVEELHAQR
jgi:hypothetical protein